MRMVRRWMEEEFWWMWSELELSRDGCQGDLEEAWGGRGVEGLMSIQGTREEMKIDEAGGRMMIDDLKDRGAERRGGGADLGIEVTGRRGADLVTGRDRGAETEATGRGGDQGLRTGSEIERRGGGADLGTEVTGRRGADLVTGRDRGAETEATGRGGDQGLRTGSEIG